MKNSTLLLLLFAAAASFSNVQIFGQVAINDDQSDPAASAMLDVKATDKGVLIPRMTAVQRDGITDPATGLTVFVTTENNFYFFNGDSWQRLSLPESAVPSAAGIQAASGFSDSILYSAAMTSNPTAIQVVGDYAYVSRFTVSGSITTYLDVYDLSDRSNITKVAEGIIGVNFSTGMALLEDYAVFLGSSPNAFRVVNISTPTDPTPPGVDAVHLAQPQALFSNGEDVLLTLGNQQADIYNYFSGVNKVVSAGRTNAKKGEALIHGNYAYVLGNGNNLNIIDFNVIASATVSSVSLDQPGVVLSAAGNYLYVASANQLEIFDISSPTSPVSVGVQAIGAHPIAIQAQGTIVYVVDAYSPSSMLQFIDVAVPTTPLMIQVVNITGVVNSFDVADGYAYLVNQTTTRMEVIPVPSHSRYFPVYTLLGEIAEYRSTDELTTSVDNFSLSGNSLSLSLAGDDTPDISIDLSSYLDNTDTQDLSLSGNILSLTDGGSVDLSPYAVDDNLGNHTATQNIQLAGNWLSYDSANNGLFINGSNNVGVGISPATKFHVFSTTNPQVTFESDAGSTLYLDRGTTSNEAALIFRTDGTENWLIGMDNAPSGNASDFAIKTSNNGNAQVLVKTDGNVGIGQTSPAEKLDVNGAIKIGTTSASNAGTVRWTGADFEGFDGANWLTFTDSYNELHSQFVTISDYGPPQLEVSSEVDEAVDQGIQVNTGLSRWQSFTAGYTGKLTTIEIDHDGVFIDNGSLKIYAGEGTNGTLLHEQTIDDSNNDGRVAAYNLNSPLPVQSGSQYTFQFVDLENPYKIVYNPTNPYPGGIYFGNSARDLNFWTYVAPEATFVGVNTDTPSSRLHVKDDFYSYSRFVMTVENSGNASGSGGLLVQAGQNSATGNTRFIQFNRPDGTQIGNIRQDTSSSVFYATTSDERLKTDITPTAYGLSDLMAIDVRDYYFKDDSTHPQTGFIAQQLAEHYPAAVTVGGADPKTDPWQVDYSKLTPLLVKSVQELKGTVGAQEQQLQSQQSEMERLRSEVTSMQSRLEEIEAKLEVTIP